MYTDFFFPSHVVASNAWSLSFKGEALHTTFYDVYRIPIFFFFFFFPPSYVVTSKTWSLSLQRQGATTFYD